MNHKNLIILVLSSFLVAASANAMKIDASSLKDWRVNDLTVQPKLVRVFTRGAEASIVPKKGDGTPTVFVFKHKYEASAKLGTSVKAWKAYLQGLNPSVKAVFRQARAYKLNGQSRFYTEILSNSDHGDQLYTAFLFVKVGNQILSFSYDAPRDEYFSNLKKVKDLYQKVVVSK